MNEKKYHVYILKCSDGTYYTGIASNLEKRLQTHKARKGSKYVASRLPFTLVYKEMANSRSQALKREFAIKKLSRKQKIKLIASSLI